MTSMSNDVFPLFRLVTSLILSIYTMNSSGDRTHPCLTHEGSKPNPEDLNEVLFADDQSLVHEKEGELQEHNSLNTQCENFRMKINIRNTETMKLSRIPGRLNTNIDGTTMKQVGEFKYLGSIFTEDGRLNREIETRV